MNKNAAGIGLLISKAMCVALTLILGASLFAAGAFAQSGCGEKCWCHSSPMDMHHSKGELIPLSAGFCNGDPMIPCDLETGQSSELPEFILCSVGDIDILCDSLHFLRNSARLHWYNAHRPFPVLAGFARLRIVVGFFVWQPPIGRPWSGRWQ